MGLHRIYTGVEHISPEESQHSSTLPIRSHAPHGTEPNLTSWCSSSVEKITVTTPLETLIHKGFQELGVVSVVVLRSN
jgi:hypothetical protein